MVSPVSFLRFEFQRDLSQIDTWKAAKIVGLASGTLNPGSAGLPFTEDSRWRFPQERNEAYSAVGERLRLRLQEGLLAEAEQLLDTNAMLAELDKWPRTKWWLAVGAVWAKAIMLSALAPSSRLDETLAAIEAEWPDSPVPDWVRSEISSSEG